MKKGGDIVGTVICGDNYFLYTVKSGDSLWSISKKYGISVDKLKDINNLGTTVIMATHDRDIVNKMKKRVIEIVKGVVERDEERGKMKRESN